MIFISFYFSFLFWTGLRLDDLIHEESPQTHEAMRRISKDELYRREYRNKVALQESLKQTLLPKEKWTTPEQVSFLFLPSSSPPPPPPPSCFLFCSFSLCCCTCFDAIVLRKLGQEVPCTCAHSGAAWGWGEGGLQRPGQEVPLIFLWLHERSLWKERKSHSISESICSIITWLQALRRPSEGVPPCWRQSPRRGGRCRRWRGGRGISESRRGRSWA